MAGRIQATCIARVVAAAALVTAAGCDPGAVAKPWDAVSVSISPDSARLSYLGERAAFTATLKDASGATIPDGTVAWSSDDTTVFSVDAAGTVTAHGNGMGIVRATRASLNAAATVRVAQDVAEVEAVGGGGQRTPPRSALAEPVVVRTLDAGGSPVPGATVTFTPGPGSGSADPGSVASDTAGLAETVWTLGGTLGAQTLDASVADGARATIAAVAVTPEEAAETLEAYGGANQWAVAGRRLPEPVVVQVLDQAGRPVGGARVTFTPAADHGSVQPRSAVSDTAGFAETMWRLGGTPGAQALTATVSGGPGIEISATAVTEEGVCARTPAVSAELVRQAGVASCADVTTEHLAAITSLPLRSSHITSLSTGDFDGLPNLWDLLLDRNQLTRLPPDIFAGLKLTRLDLSSNRLASLPPDIFAGLSSLKRLFLDRNQLAALPEGVFAGLSSLSLLQIPFNQLAEFPPDLFAGLSNLARLRLPFNQLAELPLDIFAGLSNLEVLDLGSNQLAELPQAVFAGLRKLEGLYLSDNQLATLPAHSFAGLSNLARLSLGYNQLAEIPPDIFAGLSSLKTLFLDGNQLAALPEGVFAGLSSLSLLNIPYNQLAEFPPDLFAGLSSLVHLNLHYNQLATLPAHSFAGLSKLERIRLDHNELAELPPDPFAGLAGLIQIKLNDNRLASLPPYAFAGLASLTRLELNDNRLASLPPYAFAGLAKLEQLRLERNRLTGLPPGVFSGLTALTHLNVEGNDLGPLLVGLDRADADDLLAPSPARVVATVAEGAPFPIAVALTVQRGAASADSVVVPAGETRSQAVTVTRDEGSDQAVHVSLGRPPVPPGSFSSIAVASGENMVLFARPSNQSPAAAATIPAHWLQVSGPAADLTLASYFSDPDGDNLSYTITSSDPGVAAGRAGAAVAMLEPVAEGTAVLDITAADPGGLRATQRVPVTVVPAPDPGGFNIELVISDEFTASQAAEMRKAAERWMELVTGDLPDVPVDGEVRCSVERLGGRFVGHIDDVIIFVTLDDDVAVAAAGPCRAREGSGLAHVGVTYFSRSRIEVLEQGGSLFEVALHEIGHVLGIGIGRAWRGMLKNSYWDQSDVSDPPDTHFTGPLAIAAFDAAGGTAYTGGAKVPVANVRGTFSPGVDSHWRKGVIDNEIMTSGRDGDRLSAITVQALADMGYVVDASKADPYTLPGFGGAPAAARSEDPEDAFDLGDDVIRGPVIIVDKNGKVVRIVRN